MQGMRDKIRSEISITQFGFVADKGTKNAIFTLAMTIERYIEEEEKRMFIPISFANRKLSIGQIMRSSFKILSRIIIDDKDLCMIRNLYWDQTAA